MIKRCLIILFFVLWASASHAEIVTGSVTATVTAAALGGSGQVIRVLIQSDPDNSVDVFIGSASSQPIQLTPGQSIPIEGHQLSNIFLKAASGTATINYFLIRQ